MNSVDRWPGRAIGAHPKSTILLWIAAPLLTAWFYYGQPKYWLDHSANPFAFVGDATLAAELCSLTANLLLLVIPALIVTLGFRQSLSDYGVQLGKRRLTLIMVLVGVPIFALLGYSASSNVLYQQEYPINPDVGRSAALFGLHAANLLVFYVAWEFFFRGFIQFGLAPCTGQPVAIGVQTLASTLAHFGKPPSETFGAILGGIFWGYQTRRTRSLLPAILQHWIMGLTLEYFICFG